jgi:hypothetical protein
VPTVDGATVNPAHPQHRRATFVSFVSSDAPRFQRAQMIYTIDGESRQHPSPVMIAGGRLVSLVQPLGVGRVIRYHFEGRDFAANPIRYPSHGEANFTVERLGPLPIGKLIAAVEARV